MQNTHTERGLRLDAPEFSARRESDPFRSGRHFWRRAKRGLARGESAAAPGARSWDTFAGAARGFAAQGEFVGNVFCGVLADSDELNANTYAGQAVTNFSPRLHLDVGDGEAESQIENRAFGKGAAGRDEHAAGAEVGGLYVDVFIVALACDRNFAEAVHSRSAPPGIAVSAQAAFCTHSSTTSRA